MGTQGFFPCRCVKSTLRDTHKALPPNSLFEASSDRSVGFPGVVWHQMVQLYLLGQGDSCDLRSRQAGASGR